MTNLADHKYKTLVAQEPSLAEYRQSPLTCLILSSYGVNAQRILEILKTTGITDIWVPLELYTLGKLLDPLQFPPHKPLKKHDLWLTPEFLVGEESNWPHDHVNLATGSYNDEGIPKSLQEVDILSEARPSTNFLPSAVIAVKRTADGNNSSPQYALKKFLRKKDHTDQTTKDEMKYVQGELQALRKIRHVHFIKLVASYTTERHIGILMSPVATCNLCDFLEALHTETDAVKRSKRMKIAGFFGCLATALACLHYKYRIRHKDIKPQNILIDNNRVKLADFGIALDWSEKGRTTTDTEIVWDPIYCPPEKYGGVRGTKSDIWSLGCVFLEMFSVLVGLERRHVLNKLAPDSNYCKGVDRIPEQIDILRKQRSDRGHLPLDWISKMLEAERTSRCSASELVHMVREARTPNDTMFCGNCCSEWSDSNFTYEDHEELHPYQSNPDESLQEPNAQTVSRTQYADIFDHHKLKYRTIEIHERPWSQKNWISREFVHRYGIKVETGVGDATIIIEETEIRSDQRTEPLTWVRRKDSTAQETSGTEESAFWVANLPEPYKMIVAARH